MKKLNSKGFGAIEALLILVIIGIIGGVGYFVYSSQKKTNTVLDNAAKSHAEPQKTEKQEEAKSEASEFSLITKLTSLNKKFILNVPDGWIFTNDTEQDYAYATSMTYKKGEVAKVNNEFGHRGGGFTATSFVIQYAKDGLKDYYSASKPDGTLKLNNGKEVKKYLHVINNDEMGIPDGTKSYGYQVDYEGSTIVLRYLVNPTDTDQRDLIEASIKTLNF